MNKIAISNLVFRNDLFVHTLKFLQNSKIGGIELAPTVIWREPELVPDKELKAFRKMVSDHGLSIIGLQSLAYNKPQLQLFEGPERQEVFLDHLKEMVNLCAVLGGRILSFGSPKNRIRGDLNLEEAISRVSSFFFLLAEYAKFHDIIVCFEPVSLDFNCDFINSTEEAVQLVESVNHSHFKLLLDVGNIIVNKGEGEKTIRKNVEHIAHIHLNDPQLYPPSIRSKEHRDFADILKSVSYSNWLTLEFLHCYTSIEKDVLYGIECYGPS